MANATAEKTIDKAPEKPVEVLATESTTEPTTGVRAILWNQRLDPTVSAPPRGAVEMRPFFLAYLDQDALDITPLSPTGAVQPSFKSLTLEPGLNWVDIAEWESARSAAALAGSNRERITASTTDAVERLKIALKVGLDPIEQQVEARAIVELKPLPDALMTGTLSDYGLEEIRKIVEVVNDANELGSWLASISTNAVNPHPQKKAVEALLKKAISNINAGDR